MYLPCTTVSYGPLLRVHARYIEAIAIRCFYSDFTLWVPQSEGPLCRRALLPSSFGVLCLPKDGATSRTSQECCAPEQKSMRNSPLSPKFVAHLGNQTCATPVLVRKLL